MAYKETRIMNNWKKTAAAISAAAMLMSMFGCSHKDATIDGDSSSQANTEEEEEILCETIAPPTDVKLSETTKSLIESAKGTDIELYYFFTMASFTAAPDFDPEIASDVPMYNSLYYNLLELSEMDGVNFVEAGDPAYSDYTEQLDPTGMMGIAGGDLVVKCGDNVKRIKATQFFTYNEDGSVEYNGENLIAGAISTCLNGLPTVYFIYGHGEKWMDGSYVHYGDVLEGGGYRVDALKLSETKEIPDDAAVVCIAAPQSDISKEESDIILDYMHSGGAVSMILPPCSANASFENIDGLLNEYGIAMDYDMIAAEDEEYQLTDNKESLSRYYFKADFPEGNDDFWINENVNALLESDYGYVAGISETRSFTVSDSAADTVIMPVVVTGDDSSSFVCEPVGGSNDDKKYAETRSGSDLDFAVCAKNTSNGSKLFAIGSDDMISDGFYNASLSAIRMLTVYSNAWLYDPDIDVGIPALRVR